jgi:hypothetical protein
MKGQVKVDMGTENRENHHVGSKLFNIIKGNHKKTGSHPTDNIVHKSSKVNTILETKREQTLLHIQRQLMLK